MFLDWKNQYCENDYTTQSNLQSQCNPYQITNGIFYRARTNHLKICMETQKSLNSQSSLFFFNDTATTEIYTLSLHDALPILPANAGDMGSSPGPGRSHMPRSSWAREPQLLSLRVWSLCSATREAAMVRGPRTAMKSGPHLPQLEKALAQKRRPNTAINKYKINK